MLLQSKAEVLCKQNIKIHQSFQSKILIISYPCLLMQNSKYKTQSQDRDYKNGQLLLSGAQSFKSSCSYLSNNSKLSSLMMTSARCKSQISDQSLNKKLCQNYLIVCQAFLTFFQKSAESILIQQKPLIQTYTQQLSKVLDQFSRIEEVDIISFGIFDQLVGTLLSFLQKSSGSEINQKDTQQQQNAEKTQIKRKTEVIQQSQPQFEKSRNKIVQNIAKIVYILFTGANKQVHTNTILDLEDDYQRIFMDLIMKQMKQLKNSSTQDKNVPQARKHKKSESFDKRNTQEISFQTKEANRKQMKTMINSSEQQRELLSKSYSRGSLFSKSSNNFSNFLSNSKSNDNLHENLKNLQLSKIARCQSRFRLSLGNQESLYLKSKDEQDTKQKSSSIKNDDQEREYRPKKEERPQSLTQLINKILNLQEENEKLVQQLQCIYKKYAEMESEHRQILKINKKYEGDNKQLNYKISQLISHIGEIQSQSAEEKAKIEKKLEKRIQIMEYHKKQQYKELSQINQNLHKNYQTKIQEFQQKLQRKRQKIVILDQRILNLEQQLRTEKQNNFSKIEEIKYLNEKINKNQKNLNELEITKDTLSTEIQVWRSRLEDLKILFLCQANRKNKCSILKSKINVEDAENMKIPSQIDVGPEQFQEMIFEKQNFGTGNFSQGLTTNQWKKSQFRKLKLNLDVKYDANGFVLNKIAKYQTKQGEDNQIERLRLYLSYLKQKIYVLMKQKEQYIEQLKQSRDIKYQKNKLIKTLSEHENYRGEQNQIILGCLYELIHESKEGQPSVEECAQNEKLNERMKKIKDKRRSEKSRLSQRIERKYKTCEVEQQILSQINRWKQKINQKQEYHFNGYQTQQVKQRENKQIKLL